MELLGGERVRENYTCEHATYLISRPITLSQHQNAQRETEAER